MMVRARERAIVLGFRIGHSDQSARFAPDPLVLDLVVSYSLLLTRLYPPQKIAYDLHKGFALFNEG